MAQAPNKNARDAANTAAQPRAAAQPTNTTGAQGTPVAPVAPIAAAVPVARTTQPRQAATRPRPRAGQSAVAQGTPLQAGQATNSTQAPTPSQARPPRPAGQAPFATTPAQQITGAQPTQAPSAATSAQQATGAQPTQAPSAAASAQQAAGAQPTQAPSAIAPAQQATAVPKAKPVNRATAQSTKPRATHNTVALHSTAILHLEQIARSMQRGVNEGALLEAETAARPPLRLFVNALGQALYRLGLQSEYALLRIGRGLSRGGVLLATELLLLLRTVLRPIGALFAGIWRDLTAPIVRLFRGIGHVFGAMRTASARGESAVAAGVAYAREGFKTHRHVGAVALSYLLPIAAVALLTITVWSVLNTPFSLAVTYNDKMIGYVENEAVWEAAQKKVQDRIRASSPDETFAARPQLNVTAVQVAARRDAGDMADVIISESSDQIQSATGVYVGDVLMGVCTDGAAVQQLLRTTLAAANPEDDSTARVEFINAVTTDFGLYFTDSISPLSQLESTLQAGNWLQVKLLRTEVSQAVIPYDTVEEENPDVYKGSTRVKQRGVDGEKTVTDDVSYINGVEIDRVLLSEEIIKEAVPRIVSVGTKEVGNVGSYTGSIAQGSGALLWPVPAYSYTTTEYGGHRGLDICAPYGTPIYAADGGTVVENGWHWSFGNYILIDHGNGITTRYAHNSTNIAALGQNVNKGDPIGLVGSTGVSTGNHCHFEVAVNGGLTNPRRFVSP